MKNNAQIRIRGTQIVNGEKDCIELTTEGFFCKKDGSYFISYREDELAGVKGMNTTIKIEGESRAVVMKGGPTPSTLIIEPQKRNLCHYATPYGNLLFGISNAKIHAGFDENGGSANIRYSLDVNTETFSDNVLDIKVKRS